MTAKPDQAKITKSDVKPTWCPGCGDYGVLRAVQSALAALGIAPWDTVVVSGIGCSSNLPHFLNTYGMHTLHGRLVAVATGVHLANTRLKVIGTGGDGDGYGIGVGHMVHAMRRNMDLTYIVMDNQIYGLTTGQASPTSGMEMRTKSTPAGVIEVPLAPIAIAVAAGATYVARGFSGDIKQLSELVKGAIEHPGFALVDVLSPCVTYNKINTYDFFKERTYYLEDEASSHQPDDQARAYEKAIEWGERIPLGLFYRRLAPTYADLDPACSTDAPLDAACAPEVFEELKQAWM